MADLLVYWRDYTANWATTVGQASGLPDGGGVLVWHSSAKCIAQLQPGDRLWLVTAGKKLADERRKLPQAGFLVGVWQVAQAVPNPGDDPAYPASGYRCRVIAEPSASLLFHEPVLVDHLLRPEGADEAISIGRFLQGPRRLKVETVRLLRAAAGPQMARQYLTGKQA